MTWPTNELWNYASAKHEKAIAQCNGRPHPLSMDVMLSVYKCAINISHLCANICDPYGSYVL